MERWRARFLEAIQQGFYIDPRGQRFPLDEVTGIDHLGNMLDASSLSPNPDYYGEFVN